MSPFRAARKTRKALPGNHRPLLSIRFSSWIALALKTESRLSARSCPLFYAIVNRVCTPMVIDIGMKNKRFYSRRISTGGFWLARSRSPFLLLIDETKLLLRICDKPWSIDRKFQNFSSVMVWRMLGANIDRVYLINRAASASMLC